MVVIAQLGIEYEDSCIRRNIKYVLTFITGQMSPSLYIAIYVRFPPVCNPKYRWVRLSILLVICWTTMSLSVCVRLHWQSMSCFVLWSNMRAMSKRTNIPMDDLARSCFNSILHSSSYVSITNWWNWCSPRLHVSMLLKVGLEISAVKKVPHLSMSLRCNVI